MSSDAGASLTKLVLATRKLKALGLFGKQPAGEEDYAQQDVNAVIGLTKCSGPTIHMRSAPVPRAMPRMLSAM